jgi:hypothetical protein
VYCKGIFECLLGIEQGDSLFHKAHILCLLHFPIPSSGISRQCQILFFQGDIVVEIVVGFVVVQEPCLKHFSKHRLSLEIVIVASL